MRICAHGEGLLRFMEHYHNELEQMGMKLIKGALTLNYYNKGDDAPY